MVDDIEGKTIKKIYWEAVKELPAGTVILIKLDDDTILEKKIPTGYKFNGRIQVIGNLEEE